MKPRSPEPEPESAPVRIVEFELAIEDRSAGEPGLTGVDEVDLRLPVFGSAVRLGVFLIMLSLFIGYLLAGVLALLFGVKYALFCYGISWGLFFPGLLLGGREAQRRVSSSLTFWQGRRFRIWRVRLILWRRFSRRRWW